MSTADETVVRRFYEEMCNGRHNELASELFTDGHQLHDPQVKAGNGPEGIAEANRVYQDGVDGHWQIEDLFSTGDKVVARWTGSGRHIADVNGIPATGNDVRQIEAVSIHRMEGGKIAETWQVWDTLGFLQQLGAIPQP
jgi:predicted ester cyclase